MWSKGNLREKKKTQQIRTFCSPQHIIWLGQLSSLGSCFSNHGVMIDRRWLFLAEIKWDLICSHTLRRDSSRNRDCGINFTQEKLMKNKKVSSCKNANKPRKLKLFLSIAPYFLLWLCKLLRGYATHLALVERCQVIN